MTKTYKFKKSASGLDNGHKMSNKKSNDFALLKQRSWSQNQWYQRLVGQLVFNGTFSTNRLYRVIEYEIYHVGPGTTQIHNKTTKQYIKPKVINILWPGLCGDNTLATVRLSLSGQSLGEYGQLNQNNQKTEHIPTYTNNT